MIRKLLLIATPVIIYALLQTSIESLKIILSKEYLRDYLTESDRKKRKHKIVYCIIAITCFLMALKFTDYLFMEEQAINPESFEDITSDKTVKLDFDTCTIEDVILAADSQYFTIDQLAHFLSSELRLIRNGIFAFQGRAFQEEDLNAYYSNFEWYKPRADEKIEYLDLNKYQRKNVNLIKEPERILK